MITTRSSLQSIEFNGLRIFDYTAGQDTNSSVALIEVPPGARHEEAWSKRSDKYYLITHGQVHFILDGEITEMKSGDFCLVRCGQRFSYSNVRSEMAILVLIHTPSFRIEDEVFVNNDT